MKPLYTHDCDACIFLGTWRKNPDHLTLEQDFDLYVCPCEGLSRDGTHTNCLARYGSDGPDYASMTLENEMWAASLLAINGPRQSGYHCYIPELCEAWHRWSMRTFHPNPDYAKKALNTMNAEYGRQLRDSVLHDSIDVLVEPKPLSAEDKAKMELCLNEMKLWNYPIQSYGSDLLHTVTGRLKSSLPEVQREPLTPGAQKVRDQLRALAKGFNQKDWDAAIRADYRDLELRILTADGYTFAVNADGSVGDGDLSWPSTQAFIDSHKGVKNKEPKE